MKESTTSTVWRFITHRMVQEYMNDMYLPLMERMDKIMSTESGFTKELARWKSFIHSKWPEVRIHTVTTPMASRTMNSFQDNRFIYLQMFH